MQEKNIILKKQIVSIRKYQHKHEKTISFLLFVFILQYALFLIFKKCRVDVLEQDRCEQHKNVNIT